MFEMFEEFEKFEIPNGFELFGELFKPETLQTISFNHFPFFII